MWGRNKSKLNEPAAESPNQAGVHAAGSASEAIPWPAAQAGPETHPAATTPPVVAAWQMGLVVTASALCGGIAVVLWNRRLLTKMREVEPVRRSDLQRSLWEDDV